MHNPEHYKKITDADPGDHATFNQWASDLFALWEQNQDKARLMEAIEKCGKAIAIKDDPLYHANKSRLLLWLSLNEFYDGQRAAGINRFTEALKENEKGIPELFIDELKGFFFSISGPDNINSGMHLIALVKEHGNAACLDALQPFVVANMCWTNEKNMERLKTLPKELAEEVMLILGQHEQNG